MGAPTLSRYAGPSLLSLHSARVLSMPSRLVEESNHTALYGWGVGFPKTRKAPLFVCARAHVVHWLEQPLRAELPCRCPVSTKCTVDTRLQDYKIRVNRQPGR